MTISISRGNCLENPKFYAFNGFKRPLALQIEWSQSSVGLIEAEIWQFQVAHQGYLHLRTDRPSLNQIVSGARAIGISNTDKGLDSGLSVPIFQYFRSGNGLMSHSCNVFHLSFFTGGAWSKGRSHPILGWTKASAENNVQKIFDPKWTHKYDNVGPDHARWVSNILMDPDIQFF